LDVDSFRLVYVNVRPITIGRHNLEHGTLIVLDLFMLTFVR